VLAIDDFDDFTLTWLGSGTGRSQREPITTIPTSCSSAA